MTRSVVGSMTPARTGTRPLAILTRVLDDLAPRGIVVEHDLARRAEHEEAVHAAIDQMLDDPGVGRIVDLEVLGQWGDDGGNDAMKLGHFCLCSSVN